MCRKNGSMENSPIVLLHAKKSDITDSNRDHTSIKFLLSSVVHKSNEEDVVNWLWKLHRSLISELEDKFVSDFETEVMLYDL